MGKIVKIFIIAVPLLIAQTVLALELNSTKTGSVYVAHQESLRSFFGGISSYLGKPIIVSKMAASKQISGEFDLTAKDMVEVISRQLGLITYYDGNAIYVYDAGETKNAVVTLKNITFQELTHFLKKAGLEDRRYPLRSDGADTFYLAGPPIFVDLVVQTAGFMDKQNMDQAAQHVEVIKLEHTFVVDRSYQRRDDSITIPGIATVIKALLEGDTAQEPIPELHKVSDKSVLDLSLATLPPLGALGSAHGESNKDGDKASPVSSAQKKPIAGSVRIIAYPETNSLLVRGSPEQVKFIRDLVEILDEKKRHIELTVSIIDLDKHDLDQLGVNWSGAVKTGRFGVGFNNLSGAGVGLNASNWSAVDGNMFMAEIMALAKNNRAQVISRPTITTQENIPAVFDSNHSFYIQTKGERVAQVNKVQYGTMLYVTPRFADQDEIELALEIEDGRQNDSQMQNASDNKENTDIPMVDRTQISTVARVAKDKSLLIGGYTHGENGYTMSKVPLLGDIPFIGGLFRYRMQNSDNQVRVFLIQPHEVEAPIETNANSVTQQLDLPALIQQLDKTQDLDVTKNKETFGGH